MDDKDRGVLVRDDRGGVPVVTRRSEGPPRRPRREQLFEWVYDAENLTLTYRGEGGDEYKVDLETCTTSAQLLDRIFQVSNKGIHPAAAGEFLEWLDFILNPQGTLCSEGKEQGPVVVRDRIRGFARPGLWKPLGGEEDLKATLGGG